MNWSFPAAHKFGLGCKTHTLQLQVKVQALHPAASGLGVGFKACNLPLRTWVLGSIPTCYSQNQDLGFGFRAVDSAAAHLHCVGMVRHMRNVLVTCR